MANKYLSLDEAAELLGMSSDELKRLRERGDIRGFADRGTWKFKREDVEELGRHRKPDSDPDVAIIHTADTDENISIFTDDDADVLSEQETTIRQEPESEIVADFGDDELQLGGGPTSDSDVRLILDDGPSSSSDSDDDVLIPNLKDSDSDVRLVDDRQDLIAGSDSDVKLVGDDSDSDVQLVTQRNALDDGSDSDVKIVSGNEAGTSSAEIALFADSDDEIELVDSSLALDEESGISLGSPADSGISLESVDSGITLDNEESGIRLGGGGLDSGIALEPAAAEEDELHQTLPMLEVSGDDTGDDTSFEVPSMDVDAEESVFELEALGTAAPAGKKAKRSDDDTFDLETVGEFDDDLEVEDDLGEDDDLDVFEGDDEFEDSFESGESHPEFAAPYGRGVAAPASEWGVGSVIGLGMSTLIMTLCCMVMFDLVRTMWKWDETSAVNGPIIDIVSGLF